MLMKDNQEKGHNDEDSINHQEMELSFLNQDSTFMKKPKIYNLILILSIIGLILFIYQSYFSSTKDKYYDSSLVKLQIDEFRKLDGKEMQEQTMTKIVGKGLHTISRQQLGHNTWTLLHMITGGFPPRIDENLRQRFNTFLILFGQFYPCKLCANHFMELIQTQGLFKGQTKLELMRYLCNLHNKVNKKLGKQQHSCQNIVQEWNTCGCSAAE